MPQTLPPAPDHPIDCRLSRTRVRALFEGHELADSDRAILVREQGFPDRWFFPREDVEMSVLRQSGRHTWDPYKGEASYFTIYRDKRVVDDIAWSFETAPEHLADIRGLICFSDREVDFEIETSKRSETTEADRRMSDYIRHTDSGSGSSQAEHWAPNVSNPSPLAGERDDRA